MQYDLVSLLHHLLCHSTPFLDELMKSGVAFAPSEAATPCQLPIYDAQKEDMSEKEMRGPYDNRTALDRPDSPSITQSFSEPVSLSAMYRAGARKL